VASCSASSPRIRLFTASKVEIPTESALERFADLAFGQRESLLRNFGRQLISGLVANIAFLGDQTAAAGSHNFEFLSTLEPVVGSFGLGLVVEQHL
jgi:hypothetical protein